MEAEIYSTIKTSVKRLLNIDLSYYKDEQVKRRLDSWLVRTKVNSWGEYFQVVSVDPLEMDRFRNYLTINVTEFFRDLERWATLRKDIIPALLEKTSISSGGLRVWSAGCSIGVEAYTLGIVLDEAAPGRKHTLLATDMDRGALAKARAGGPYLAEEIRNLTSEQRQKYLKPGPPYFIQDSLVHKITFKEQDMLTERFDCDFDLIVCRNVIIYFTTEAKTMLYTKFHDALRPGGVLFLGGTEIISKPAEFGFRNIGISLYKRI